MYLRFGAEKLANGHGVGVSHALSSGGTEEGGEEHQRCLERNVYPRRQLYVVQVFY